MFRVARLRVALDLGRRLPVSLPVFLQILLWFSDVPSRPSMPLAHFTKEDSVAGVAPTRLDLCGKCRLAPAVVAGLLLVRHVFTVA